MVESPVWQRVVNQEGTVHERKKERQTNTSIIGTPKPPNPPSPNPTPTVFITSVCVTLLLALLNSAFLINDVRGDGFRPEASSRSNFMPTVGKTPSKRL